MSFFCEVDNKHKLTKKILVMATLWFFGRVIQAAAKVDREVAREFAELPDGFAFTLEVMPNGPGLVVGKDETGRVKYLGANIAAYHPLLRMRIKNMNAAFALFTLQEGNAISAARNRLVIEGDVAYACATIRILEIVEVYLLPKILARLALKRYPRWQASRKYFGRVAVYARTLLGV